MGTYTQTSFLGWRGRGRRRGRDPVAGRRADATPPFPLGVGSFDPQADRVIIWTRVVTAASLRGRWRQLRASRPSCAPAPSRRSPPTTSPYRSTSTDSRRRRTTGTASSLTVARARSDAPRRCPIPARLSTVSASAWSPAPSGSSATSVPTARSRSVTMSTSCLRSVTTSTSSHRLRRDPFAPRRRAYARAAPRDRGAGRLPGASPAVPHRPRAAALHAAHPVIAIYDDHEVANDWYRNGAQGHDPATEGSFLTRRDAGLQAFREYVPVRADRQRRDGLSALHSSEPWWTCSWSTSGVIAMCNRPAPSSATAASIPRPTTRTAPCSAPRNERGCSTACWAPVRRGKFSATRCA